MVIKDFIEFALKYKVLKFGDFKLKSGRISPYFFNIAQFNDANALLYLSKCYAKILSPYIKSLNINNLFGPAYKGISLAAVTSVALLEYGYNLDVSFNRKEAKDHGEGGIIIGAPIKGNIALIDDVITAGTTVYEVKKYVESKSANLKLIAIALDRQEVDANGIYTKEALSKDDIKLESIITMDNLIEYLQDIGNNKHLDKILAYKDLYGVH